MEEERRKLLNFIKKPVAKHLLGIHRYTWEEYVKMNFKEVEGKGVVWV
jgi:hypothetical protein